jgi:hypothetical protein
VSGPASGFRPGVRQVPAQAAEPGGREEQVLRPAVEDAGEDAARHPGDGPARAAQRRQLFSARTHLPDYTSTGTG